jgi:hypothetical protein
MSINSTFAKLSGIAALVAMVAVSVDRVSAQTAPSLSDLLGQLKSGAASSGDATLKSLTGDLGSKAQALNKSLAGSPETQTQLGSALQSLLANKGGESLAGLQKLSQAKLTPEQTKLAKDVGQLGSAYLVQKNLASLEGSQTEVGQIVNSLRKGKVTEAMPAIQKVSQNAQLTPAQKDLLTSVANHFAPGAGKVGETLKGVKGLPGFGK